MTFQAYLDTIRAKTGKGPDEFRALAQARGLTEPGVKAGAVVAWLKADFGLGSGHAMAIYESWRRTNGERKPAGARLEALFSGPRAAWRPVLAAMVAAAEGYGGPGEIGTSAADKYVSLTRAGKKFAILQPGAAMLDLGFKVPGAAASGRVQPAGAWNSMVTHRARVAHAREVDAELMDWLRRAWEAVKV